MSKRRIGTQAARVRNVCWLCNEKKTAFFINVREPEKKRIYVCADCIVDIVEEKENAKLNGSVLPELLAEADGGEQGADTNDGGSGTKNSGPKPKRKSAKRGARKNTGGVK